MRWLLGLCFLASPAAAVTCKDVQHLGASYTICDVGVDEDLQLFLGDDDGNVLGSFRAVENYRGVSLSFAMNAGMYHDDRSPVGHYVEDFVPQRSVMTREGPGNFGLLPNGVFCSGETFQVFETLKFLEQTPLCADATQSGPMLVIDGELHPRFIPDGTSKFIRNGVGTPTDGQRAYFAISNEPVNFHDFATLFRDHIGVPNALYFDGKVSRLHAPQLNRSDFGWQLGPIIGVVDADQ
ncbi:phosphodiester glycosidase family protein [Octadecabacter sp. 1_MG-2023]|uniref:phosphodiester glycosidase family protein n=1 Tax=unclassified Octadecabacter TaxID=196158 RepID=UPI001C08DE7F|nr:MULTISPECIES: phosphodiester glycosidase family protein [unclassified Octadecabacter]MBU2992112.1 phosphodiester glycosidase family protein [Octadecabacter sp. B2R22]MDO6735132.1 phosphodiester glycosidase family protein [Octadecabacter sp. 1_MG-2023]